MRKQIQLCGVLALFSLTGPYPAAQESLVSELQNQLIEEIQRDTEDTRGYTGREKLSARVLEAMRSVPRHQFVEDYGPRSAYANRPLPIGHGQTISQPFIVALMTDLLEPRPDHVVLEIGTGSGYQAAVLSTLVDSVYSIEIIEVLAESARVRLERNGYDNVWVKVGDGYHGWPERGPFDGIIVTAAGPDIPQPLLDQLKTGGVMVLPLRRSGGAEDLTVVTKMSGGSYEARSALPVAFVPLTGDH
jgi:protein-L-isoaspartate(D-aspartate) O-methyltransferase|tara:strand:- start:2062 stop:2799 length:738 start_codon:yes stop_codon:yes gene_type:complete